MGHSGFVHLRVHSAYSLSEGAIKIEPLVELCRRLAMPAVAVTDTGNLFGALEFALAARDAGVQPIIGCLAIARAARAGAGSPSIWSIGDPVNLTPVFSFFAVLRFAANTTNIKETAESVPRKLKSRCGARG